MKNSAENKTVKAWLARFRSPHCQAQVLKAVIVSCAVAVTSAVPAAQAQLPAPAYDDSAQKSQASDVPYLPPPSDDAGASAPAPTPAPRPTPKPQLKPQPKPQSKTPAKLPSLTVGGVSVRGITDVAAIKKLKRAHEKELQDHVTLWDGRTAHHLSRASLGASIPYYQLLAQARAQQKTGGDIPLAFEVDLNKARRTMKYLSGKVNHAPANASLDVDETGKVLLRGGEGAELALEDSVQRIKAALESVPPQKYVPLVVTRQPGTSTLRQFKYLLAEYSTPYDAALRGRTNNLKMAAHNVNGTLVAPGKIFSTNNSIGPRNAAAGWKEAKMFVDGQVVDGVGAGICQCATTLYNAALLANMPIVERHPHTFRVKYAPASRDATIYWGHKDMKFRNNTKGPIYVQTFVRNNRFYARLFSTEPLKVDVAVESRILSSRSGTSSEAYRIVQSNGSVKREKLSRDYYRPAAH